METVKHGGIGILLSRSCAAGHSSSIGPSGFVSWFCGFFFDEGVFDGLISRADGVWQRPFPHAAKLIFNLSG